MPDKGSIRNTCRWVLFLLRGFLAAVAGHVPSPHLSGHTAHVLPLTRSVTGLLSVFLRLQALFCLLAFVFGESSGLFAAVCLTGTYSSSLSLIISTLKGFLFYSSERPS